ncbi:MAG TPA: cytochrome P450 [Jatrophihabitans sp.]|jgi:cytochrome P450
MTAVIPDKNLGRVEIDFDVYNPFDEKVVRDPFDQFNTLLNEYPIAFHRGINAWLIAPHALVQEALKSPKFSARFTDWKDFPAPKPESQWNLYDRVQANSLLNLAPGEHQRVRRLTAPAFSRRVMDHIEERIKDTIVDIFDEIDDPAEFNAATQIAQKVPIRSIARMVGVPPEAEEIFEHGLGWNMVRASNPMYSEAEREQFINDALPGMQYLLDSVAEHRARRSLEDDFIGTLIKTSENGESLNDLEIVSLISALVTAGADTAVDLHTLAIHALLSHPDQRQILRDRPELMEDAIIEVIRYAGHGKFGGIPRFPYEDMDFHGQVMEKGTFVMPLFSTAWLDPAKWPEPRKFDITRDHAGNTIFGAGPHLCIGLNLVKVQGKLMIEEFERRFGDSAGLVGEIEYDPMHFNARRMTTLMVKTRTK